VRGVRGMKSATRDDIGHQLTRKSLSSHSELNHCNELTVALTSTSLYLRLNNKDRITRIKINLTTVRIFVALINHERMDEYTLSIILSVSILRATVYQFIQKAIGTFQTFSLVYVKLTDLIYCVRTNLFTRLPRLSKLKRWHWPRYASINLN